MKFSKIIILILAAILGSIGMILVSLLIVWPILIPDDCYYHTHDKNLLIFLLYNFPSSEGGHSVPSVFNFLIFGLSGAFLAVKLTKFIMKHIELRKSNKPANETI